MQEQQVVRRSCGAHIEHRRLLNEDPSYVAARSRIETLARAYEESARRTARVGVTRIPVVVHVVWNTQAQNISDAQIQSQIDVLNQDFRRTNADISQVPGVWQSVAADARVEFFLATTDPNGNPTNGITRTQTQTASFQMQGNPVKSAATGGTDPWPADRYLNMWVCQLSGGLLGYAQFPGGPTETDGVVILHSAFGTNGTATAPFNRGRTATHEVGHWMNLFHIWGDDGTGFNGTDEVNDTPNAAGPNYECPTFPSVSCNNGPNGDMFMNYMDYTDDACMFMFTTRQVARIDATLDGPRSSFHPTWGWHHNNLTWAASAPGAVGDPAGYTWDVDNTQHVVYRGWDSHIHELWFNGAWHHNDLTWAAGAPGAVGDPAGYTWDVDRTQHVVYRGGDSHIHELWFNLA